MAFIKLERVSVDIPIFNASSRSLKNNIISAATGGEIRPHDNGRLVVRAIDDLSIELVHGSRVGLVGHNGAGKSTILRVMAGIYPPTAGSITSDGVTSCMFDLAFGMDPDATGWDNIVLRGVLLGYSLREVKAQAEVIGEASGLGEFLDMPVRTYSTGMVTRLAFAVSTSIKPDILLVDEGIGAGDAAFLETARKRMNEFISNAGLLVLATHSDELLRQWCDTAIWMEHGRMKMHADVEEVLTAYHASIAEAQTQNAN